MFRAINNVASSFVDWCLDNDFIGMCVFLLAIIVGALAVAAAILAPFIIADAREPNFSLKKAEWGCTASHQAVIHGGYMSGKVWIPTTSIVTVCDQWTRRS